MVCIENHIGKITISEKYLTELVTHAVTGCIGVADICSASTLSAVIPGKSISPENGVQLRTNKDGGLIIDIHIKVTYGTNISAVVKSITHEVCFAVEEATETAVHEVNVFVDGMNY